MDVFLVMCGDFWRKRVWKFHKIFFHQFFIPATTGIGKISHEEYEATESRGYLLQGVRHFSGMGKIGGHLIMVDNGF